MEDNADLEQEHLLREADEYQEQLTHYLSLRSVGEKTAYLASIGISTFTEHAFTRIPLFSIYAL